MGMSKLERVRAFILLGFYGDEGGKQVIRFFVLWGVMEVEFG